ncbi:tRNA (adenosine(37)-N6)-threonylcarbamoyltransferase complex ATPase subunit type 1 TsaE [Rosistilla oblonga]|uniref:tRNA (adenosine(37)-N6)-threonylcarbamoyltransferase complex ATPase subunit type 1 TsaE n=2 Tax=Rosistilla oblonga TaxID=2527990 RepID=UPI003A979EB8
MHNHQLCRMSIHSLDDTDRLGRMLAQRLPDRATIGLVGTLGAGKTRLVQSVAAAIGVPEGTATSPTFTLIQPYHAANRRIYHVDAYRVNDLDEFLELGIEELMEEPGAWVFVEWGDRVADVFPDETLWLQIEVVSPTQREVTFFGDPAVWESLFSNSL